MTDQPRIEGELLFDSIHHTNPAFAGECPTGKRRGEWVKIREVLPGDIDPDLALELLIEANRISGWMHNRSLSNTDGPAIQLLAVIEMIESEQNR